MCIPRKKKTKGGARAREEKKGRDGKNWKSEITPRKEYIHQFRRKERRGNIKRRIKS
jgi:hypothetical protein